MLDVLAIGPHPDDVEIAMGGAIALFVRQGLKVAILDLTDGEPTPLGSPEIRSKESAAASSILGVETRVTLDLPNRFLSDTAEARIKVAEVIRTLRPRALFVPYWEDAHPDHLAAGSISEAARFYAKFSKTDWKGEPHYPAKVVHYFCSHLRLFVRPTFVLDISETFELKMEAIRAYASQFSLARGNVNLLDDIEIQARFWGERIGCRYGEPFLTRELLGLSALSAVVLS
jgi:bacillithiol biosynthesis deacetylase BshB1